jgi:hypothetical protein
MVVNSCGLGHRMPELPLADDLVEGAKKIGAEYGWDERRTREMLAQKAIPAFKMGGRWFSRRSTIRADIERRERGEAT